MSSKFNSRISEMYEKGHKKIEETLEHPEKVAPEVKTEGLAVIKNSKSFISNFFNNFSDYMSTHKDDLKYLLLLVPIAAIFFIVWWTQRPQSIKTGAAIHQATVSFQLSSWPMPPASTFTVWINADAPVGFANIDLSFDPTKVKLANEIPTLYPPLTKDISITSMASANSTGKISIVKGLDPANIANPPSGTFQLVPLNFTTNTASQTTTVLSFNSSAMQMVALDQGEFTLTTNNLTLALNGTPAPTAVPTLTPTPVATRTPTPTPTKTATAVPTATSSSCNVYGDANGSCTVDILDINTIIRYYDQPVSVWPKADVNGDGSIDILDINVIIQIIRQNG